MRFEQRYKMVYMGLHGLQLIFPRYLMDMGSVLGSRLRAVLNYRKDPYVHP